MYVRFYVLFRFLYGKKVFEALLELPAVNMCLQYAGSEDTNYCDRNL